MEYIWHMAQRSGEDEQILFRQGAALPILEGAAFVLFFRGYLREFDRLPLGDWGWWCAVVVFLLALAWGVRLRPELTRKVLTSAILMAAFAQVLLSRYGTAAWPLSRKMAGYATSIMIHFFHFLSLYLMTWIPCLFRIPFVKPLRRSLLAGFCLFLLCDYEYFRQTGGHVQVGHIAMFFGRDSMRHIGLAPQWWRQPLLSLIQLATLLASARLLAGKVDRAVR